MSVYGKRIHLQSHARSTSPRRVVATPVHATGLRLSTLQRDVLALQHAAGNQAVSGLIQAKLTVGPAGDQYEQEADRVAERVLSMPTPVSQPSSDGVQRQEEEEEIQTKPLAASITPLIQRQEDEEEIQTAPLQRQPEEEEDVQMTPLQRQEEEEEVQMMPLQRQAEEEEEIQTQSIVQRQASGGFSTNQAFETRLNGIKSGGQPLTGALRAEFEPKFGADFSGVRIHTGGEAAYLNRCIQAKAFTHGRSIYMGEGQYRYDTSEGKRLLAHELTHVVQQNSGLLRRWTSRPGSVSHLSNQVVQRNGDAPAELLSALDELDGKEPSKKHIMVPKHKWNLVVADPSKFVYSNEKDPGPVNSESWTQVKAVMRQVLEQGVQTAYKRSALQRQFNVKGKDVVVTFVNPKEKMYKISDGWVVDD